MTRVNKFSALIASEYAKPIQQHNSLNFRLVRTVHMGGWKPYDVVYDGGVPHCPGVYEICWEGDDKPRYIGQSSDLRRRLMDHPHRDSEVQRFINKHMNSRNRPPMVRFKPMPTPEEARQEEKKRIIEFEKKYGDKPQFNQNY